MGGSRRGRGTSRWGRGRPALEGGGGGRKEEESCRARRGNESRIMQGLWRERERMRGNGMKEMNETIMLIIIFFKSYCTINFSPAFFDINLHKINLNVIQAVLIKEIE